MNTQSTLRFGGIAAIISALLYVASMVLWMGAGDTGAPPPLAAASASAGRAEDAAAGRDGGRRGHTAASTQVRCRRRPGSRRFCAGLIS